MHALHFYFAWAHQRVFWAPCILQLSTLRLQDRMFVGILAGTPCVQGPPADKPVLPCCCSPRPGEAACRRRCALALACGGAPGCVAPGRRMGNGPCATHTPRSTRRLVAHAASFSLANHTPTTYDSGGCSGQAAGQLFAVQEDQRPMVSNPLRVQYLAHLARCRGMLVRSP